MCGVGFSGKSTLSKKIAEHLGATLISWDAIYFEMKDKLSADNASNELAKLSMERISDALRNGKSVVFDFTSLKRAHREKLRNLAKEFNADSKIIFLDTPIEVQKERQELNKVTKERHDVKQEYLDYAIAELEVPAEDENVVRVKPNYDFDELVHMI